MIPRYQRRRIDDVAVGLTCYAGFCCAVTAALAFGLYGLMQPTRLANPGMAAYQPRSASMFDFASSRRLPDAEPIPAALEPASETTPQPQTEAKKAVADARPAKPKPQRQARRRRDPMRDYAYQPFYGGGYGGYGGFGGYRRW